MHELMTVITANTAQVMTHSHISVSRDGGWVTTFVIALIVSRYALDVFRTFSHDRIERQRRSGCSNYRKRYEHDYKLD